MQGNYHTYWTITLTLPHIYAGSMLLSSMLLRTYGEETLHMFSLDYELLSIKYQVSVKALHNFNKIKQHSYKEKQSCFHNVN